MRRGLLNGTALVAAATAAAAMAAPAQAQIHLSLEGIMQQFLGYANSDTNVGSGGDAFNGFDVKSNSEIYFVGSTTLDNGLKFGVSITLEGNSNADNQIDDSFMFVEGSFGRFNIGGENSAGYLMSYAAPDVGLGVNSTSILTGFLPQAGGFAGANFFDAPLGSTYLELDAADKSQKISYFTPRFSGFQLGASYLPDPNKDSNAQVDETTVSYRDGFSLGANYVDTIGEVDVAISGRYDWANDQSAAGSDPSLYAFGLNLGYAGFTIGGSYAHTDDQGADTGRSFDLGASYETGPWGVSVTYFNGRAEADTTVAGDSTYKAYEGAVSYALGPGVTAIGSVSYQDLDADTGDKAKTWAVVGGFALEF
ncbi:Outer membrane protein (porin) [Tistlia consotensis]|uniref:Outer membrane protein (Porin) n=1 Tax=Tistlia consotensis USBA 355 TaxID=560819 RepID=A0A1Y6BNG5_9PROT|nr:porin [Tistlia consotensis]SMF12850.1 Outer membrane protein (porin) [Tistlia consotensis USBA 355]SNR50874.1 Outer membrane protein (porin) [Tistlia consotensis]